MRLPDRIGTPDQWLQPAGTPPRRDAGSDSAALDTGGTRGEAGNIGRTNADPRALGYRAPSAVAAIERRRLAAVGEVFDGATIARLRRFGVGPGWRCLDIGAGAGSVARALGALVAPSGEVLATDVDLRFFGERDLPHVEARVHDITSDELAADAFDLAHARGVLEHVRAREAGLAHIVAATRPGGLVVVEDPDWLVFDQQDLPAAFGELQRRVRDAYVQGAGYDPYLGRRLGTMLTAAGLRDVDVDGRVFTMRGGEGSMEWYVLGLERGLPSLIATGVIDQALADRALAEARDPGLRLLSPLQVTAWGRKPR